MLDVPSTVWYHVSWLLQLFMIWNKRFISLVTRLRLCTERSHSGLVRRFAKPLRWKRLREFESLPLRHQYSLIRILIELFRGVAQLAEQPSPKFVRPCGAFVLTVWVQYY